MKKRQFMWRMRTSLQIIKRIAQEPCWRGARREDTPEHYVLVFSTARLRVFRVLP